jgi:exonuclease SbcD
VFAGISYTALGHLHGPQQPRLDGPGVVRYSGSPLRYSFSEAGHVKSVTIVELGPGGSVQTDLVPVPQPRPMAQIEGPIADLLMLEEHDVHVGAWIKAIVTDPIRPELMVDRLRQRFPHLLSAQHLPEGRPIDLGGVGPGTLVDPIEVVLRFVADATGRDTTDDEKDLVRKYFESVRREEEDA